tara:strand:- start:167 stop:1237 length:1071 start_codon:yes stop_codon:yes gene_type:complete
MFLSPLVFFYMMKNKIVINKNFLLWLSLFIITITISFIHNLFFGFFEIYYNELIIRTISYLVSAYFFIIGIIFYYKKELISPKFYYFFVILGFIQVYAILGFPGSQSIVFLLDNYLIDSFANPANHLLFLEAEPSYIAYFIIFLVFFYDYKKGKILWLFFSLVSLSVRSTIISLLLFIKRHPITFSICAVIPLIFLLNKYQISYVVVNRLKNMSSSETMDPSTYIRYVKNVAAYKILKDNFIIGVGPGQYSTYYTGVYLDDYDTRGIVELENARISKSKIEDPYSFILGFGSELGLIGLSFLFYGLFVIFRNTNKKYFLMLVVLILAWDYPYGKPFLWIILGYLFEEGRAEIVNSH